MRERVEGGRRGDLTGPDPAAAAPEPLPVEQVLALQRGAGNAAVAAALGGLRGDSARQIQRMATPNELVAEVGLPPKGGSVFGRDKQKRAGVFDELLGALDLYRTGTTNVVSGIPHVRADQSKALVTRLDAVAETANRYEGDTGTRGARVRSLRDEARAEIALIGAINRDPAYDGRANPAWSAEIARRQFELNLHRARTGVETLDVLSGELADTDDPAEQKDIRGAIEITEDRVQTGYLNALDLLTRQPALVRGRPLREVAETLLEANRRAGDQATRALEGVGKVAQMGELKARVESIAAAHEDTVAAKVAAVAADVQQQNPSFAANDLVTLTRVDEDIALVCGVVRTSHQTADMEPPGWLDWMAYRAGARVQDTVRAYRRANPNVTLAGLPRALTAAYSLLGPTNPLKDWVEPVFKEDARATGEATEALERARENAAGRADDDYDKALERLEKELHIDRSKVEDVLRRSLLALAKAPLTINFDHRKLQLILNSGGFKNYWQVNQPLAQPADTASAEDKQKYAYQQERLEGEHRLFGGTGDLNTKKQKAAEQAISTGANVMDYRLGAAPTATYGRSVAVLRDRIKQRATYTPYDALDLLKKIAAGEAFVGPEVVGTHQNLAAIIRYAPVEAVRDIIKKAENPRADADMPMANYVEAQIHGPITIADIERITVSEEEVEDSAYDTLSQGGAKRPDPDEIKAAVDALKLTIQQTLATHGITVEFASM
jgi:hypothetical protein